MLIRAGRHVPGILMLGQGWSIGETADDLALIAAAGPLDVYRDRLTFLPIGR